MLSVLLSGFSLHIWFIDFGFLLVAPLLVTLAISRSRGAFLGFRASSLERESGFFLSYSSQFPQEVLPGVVWIRSPPLDQ